MLQVKKNWSLSSHLILWEASTCKCFSIQFKASLAKAHRFANRTWFIIWGESVTKKTADEFMWNQTTTCKMQQAILPWLHYLLVCGHRVASSNRFSPVLWCTSLALLKSRQKRYNIKYNPFTIVLIHHGIIFEIWDYHIPWFFSQIQI